MTVINKVNDDSEGYFSGIEGNFFVIQCCTVFYGNLLNLMRYIFVLIIRAIFLNYLCSVKVPLNLQIETS